MFPGPVSNANTSSGRAPRNHRNIRNPPNIQSHAPHFRIPVQQIIHERHQWRPLPARRHIRRPKIRNRRNSGPRRDNARLANLQSRSHSSPAQKSRRRPLMKNRLPVRPNHSNRTQRHTPPLQAAKAAAANSSPSKKFSWLISAVEVAPPLASRKIAARTEAGNST